MVQNGKIGLQKHENYEKGHQKLRISGCSANEKSSILMTFEFDLQKKKCREEKARRVNLGNEYFWRMERLEDAIYGVEKNGVLVKVRELSEE